MKQKALNALIRRELVKGLAKLGVTTPVKQGYQPTSQGRVDEVIYYWRLADDPDGWQYRENVPDPVTFQTRIKETQVTATSYQIGALIPDDPQNDNQLTAMDITTMCRQVVMSVPFGLALQAEGVGIQRASQIRNPQFVNDEDQYEFQPSFDFTVTHKQVIIQSSSSIESVEFNIGRI